MNLILDKWSDILEHIRKEHELSDVSFETWLLPLKIHSIEGHTVRIIVPVDQMVTYLNSKFKIPIYVAIAEFTGEKYDIEFITKEEADAFDLKQKKESPAASALRRQVPVNVISEQSNINAKYTFDTFVVGNNNKFAHAASLAVAETPGIVYNPLFLHGGVGLGKTHLMHAIANHILNINPNMKVLYVTSEYFTNELIETLRAGDPTGMTKFREKYRNIDVLLIDDVQFIIGKESTQEEFFHTFNSLHNVNKQIIISSDRPPKDIETLEERLRTRFECGLIADISSPDFETRMAILRKKEELEGYQIDDGIITYIATNVKSNIRELEGAFNRLIALSTLEKRPIDMPLAEEAIKDIISPGESRKVTPELIIDIVAEHFHVKPDDIKGKKRTADIVYPRQIAMYLCQDHGTSFKRIGELLGGRDHTTVMHGVEKISNELKVNDSTVRLVETIRKKIYPN
ncbi:MAG: chromosomal replication initiator protein DnaA [Lachnospiraceae bacterium]|jgi:chromosomal replication initiator protein|nr:chromosomal replication initiator protein DnaA [Lachnospiraceae bacterium]